MSEGAHVSGTAGEVAPTRPLRADAVLNRHRLLAAAEEVFAQDGVNAQVDVIAERAGVGVGTLYRRFPTKEALIEAVIRARLQDLIDQAAAFAGADDPGDALRSFLGEFARHAAAKRDLFDALGSAGIDFKSRCAEDYEAMRAGVERLVVRAQASGSVRADVSTDDVIGLVVGACHAIGSAPEAGHHLDQMISVICDGLRATPETT